ncbi:YybH family protein [Pseudonocardia benzenivorans]|uniref:YybH family protein n=1 Tax=Pseudonocardia benzenivorans TaxID=228005 RepID=A0ABW3VR17_9PSEU
MTTSPATDQADTRADEAAVRAVLAEEAAVRALLAEEAEAMRTRDAELAVARYATDAMIFDLAPPLGRRGHAAAGVRAWLAGFDGPVTIETTELEVTVGGDLAFAHGLRRMSAVPAGAAEGFSFWYRATTCLRRVQGRWRVVHEHTSTPFHMDGSFRAATDLQP